MKGGVIENIIWFCFFVFPKDIVFRFCATFLCYFRFCIVFLLSNLVHVTVTFRMCGCCNGSHQIYAWRKLSSSAQMQARESDFSVFTFVELTNLHCFVKKEAFFLTIVFVLLDLAPVAVMLLSIDYVLSLSTFFYLSWS